MSPMNDSTRIVPTLSTPVALRRVLTALAVFACLGLGAVSASAADDASGALAGVVNINTASVEQLTWLPGVGPAKAERIVAYRAKRPFAKVVHLARVKGIGLKTVRNLKPWLTVKGETTLQGPVGGKRGKKSARKSGHQAPPAEG